MLLCAFLFWCVAKRVVANEVPCGGDHTWQPISVPQTQTNQRARRSLTNDWQNLNIEFYYTDKFSVGKSSEFSSKEIRFVKKLVDHTVRDIRSLLSTKATPPINVRTLNGRIMCGGGTSDIDRAHLLSAQSLQHNAISSTAHGVTSIQLSAHMLLVVDGGCDGSCEKSCSGKSHVIAFARECQNDAETRRPIVSKIYLCRRTLANILPDTLWSTMRHEMIHALGFGSGNFGGDKMVSFGNVSWSVSGLNTTHTYHRAYLRKDMFPTAFANLKKHFGIGDSECAELPGIELENGGGSGSQHSHLEKRIFGNDLMTATIGDITYISPILAGILNDLGRFNNQTKNAWYRVNETLIGLDIAHYWFGRGRGCSFLTDSCYEYISKQKSRNEKAASAFPYCSYANTIDSVVMGGQRVKVCKELTAADLRCEVFVEETNNKKSLSKTNELRVHTFDDEMRQAQKGQKTLKLYTESVFQDNCPMFKIHRRPETMVNVENTIKEDIRKLKGNFAECEKAHANLVPTMKRELFMIIIILILSSCFG